MTAKISRPGRDLFFGQLGLLRGQEARTCLARHRMGEAVVRTMAGLGVFGTSTTRLAALDRPFGDLGK